jgi:retron-type reverse transcriptase
LQEFSTINNTIEKYKCKKKKILKKIWKTKPVFSNHNFGFRPNKSTHDIIRNIKLWSKNTIWFLNYNIKKTLNNATKNKLLNLFLKHFKSPNLNILISIMLKNDVLKKKKEIFEKLNISQESILSVRHRKVHKLISLLLIFT